MKKASEFRKMRLGIAIAVTLVLLAMSGSIASASSLEYFLNGRDFEGLLVTGSPTDSHSWWTYIDYTVGEVETYGEANAAGVGVRTNTYPDISIITYVPANTYRVWIYQIDSPDYWARTLETTVGTDAPVQTHFDPDVVGYHWAWQDVGIHDVAPGDQITVKAVGAFVNHGADVPERRGMFRTVLLTTDLGATPPAYEPDGQTATTHVDAAATAGEIYPGDTVDVDLTISDAADLFGAQSECSVDPAVLEGQSSAWGDIFDPANRYVAEDTIDGVTGLWNGAISLLAPATPINGNGAYTTLTYEGVAPGVTTFDCTSLLVNEDGEDLAHTFAGTSVTVLQFATIDGVATYQGRQDHAGIDVTATGIVTASDTTISDGSFTLVDLKADTYDIVADAALYLPNCTSASVAPGDALTLADTRLRGGDTNDDDDVDIGDAALVASNFRQDVPPAPANADINADGRINIRDLVILASNYGRSGCQSW